MLAARPDGISANAPRIHGIGREILAGVKESMMRLKARLRRLEQSNGIKTTTPPIDFFDPLIRRRCD
jgi:hypothetical protein